jgi:hypothetical protein
MSVISAVQAPCAGGMVPVGGDIDGCARVLAAPLHTRCNTAARARAGLHVRAWLQQPRSAQGHAPGAGGRGTTAEMCVQEKKVERELEAVAEGFRAREEWLQDATNKAVAAAKRQALAACKLVREVGASGALDADCGGEENRRDAVACADALEARVAAHSDHEW